MKAKQLIFGAAGGALCVLALCALTPGASAATISGTLSLGICTGGGVVVSATTITWSPSAGAGAGCVGTAAGTDITEDGSTVLGVGDTSGVILDLTSPTSFPVTDFITFTDTPGLTFALGSLGPGSADTNCAALTAGQSCSAFVGSPFFLQLTSSGGTEVGLSAFGTVTDSLTGAMGTWRGGFTTPLSAFTPAQIQQIIGLGGSIPATSFGGNFTVTTVPEPNASYLLFGGFAMIALGAFRRRKRVAR